MKKLFISILFILATSVAFGGNSSLDSSNLKRVILTNEIIDKESSTTMDTFPLYSRGYLYTEFINIGEEKTIYHNWYLVQKDGEKTLMASVPLKIEGARWRTWSSKNLFLSGKWLVEVVDEDDNILSTTELYVK